MRPPAAGQIGAVVLVSLALLVACGSSAGPGGAGQSAAQVELAAVVARWPPVWTVTGTHSEATYVEHIRVTRRAEDFQLTIDVTAQGAQAGGRWSRTVRVGGQGAVVDLDPAGCAGNCTELDSMRGYLAAAVLLALHRSGTGPTSGVVRKFGPRSVICVAGDALYAAAGTPVAPGAVVLDPCFDRTTGAVVAQYAPMLGTFGGPTLDTSTLTISA